MYRSAVVSGLLVSVTACAAVEAPSVGPPWCAYIQALAADTDPVQYVCDGAEAATLNVHFLTTEPPTMIVRRGDVLSLLTLQRSASGARYQGDDLSFWEHHGEARVTRGADAANVRCQALP